MCGGCSVWNGSRGTANWAEPHSPAVCLGLQALEKEGKKVRVVSLVCWELFEEQPQSYKDSVLPPAVTNRVSVEAGSSFGWHR